MEWVRSYILTITAAGILCAIVKNISSGKAGGRMMSLVCGVFLILAAISPVYSVDISGWNGDFDDFRNQAREMQTETSERIRAQMDEVIRERTAAYILDKGAALGAALDVEVILDSENGYSVPKSVRISGDYSPYIKARLGLVLEQDLGIPPERQEWF